MNSIFKENSNQIINQNSNNNSLKTISSNEPPLFLNKKRKSLPDLSIFCPMSKNKFEDEYEKLSWLYKNMFSFKWSDKTIIKDISNNGFLSNLNPESLWFLLCSNYFPTDLQYLKGISNKEIVSFIYQNICSIFNSSDSNNGSGYYNYYNNDKNTNLKKTFNTRQKLSLFYDTFYMMEGKNNNSGNTNMSNSKLNNTFDINKLELNKFLNFYESLYKSVKKINQDNLQSIVNRVQDYLAKKESESNIEKINQNANLSSIISNRNPSTDTHTHSEITINTNNSSNSNNTVTEMEPLSIPIPQSTKPLSPSKEYQTLISKNQILRDMQFHTILQSAETTSENIQTISNYITYLNKETLEKSNSQKNMKKILSIEEELSLYSKENQISEQWICCICNNGNVDDHQLIYQCDSCNLTVHQACYGIQSEDVEHWKCDACIDFNCDLNKVRNLRCVLCPIKGGAMKHVELPEDCQFVKNLDKIRQNSLNIGKKKCKDEVSKEIPRYNSCVIIPDEKNNYDNMHCAWAHLSCILWNNKIEIQDTENKKGIKHIDLLDFYRYVNDACSICGIKGYGPVIKCSCEDCNVKFHPECARMNRCYMEIINDKGTLNYHIYCYEHIPNNLIKSIKRRNDYCKEEILNFGNYLQKVYRNYEKEYKKDLLEYSNKKFNITNNGLNSNHTYDYNSSSSKYPISSINQINIPTNISISESDRKTRIADNTDISKYKKYTHLSRLSPVYSYRNKSRLNKSNSSSIKKSPTKKKLKFTVNNHIKKYKHSTTNYQNSPNSKLKVKKVKKISSNIMLNKLKRENRRKLFLDKFKEVLDEVRNPNNILIEKYKDDNQKNKENIYKYKFIPSFNMKNNNDCDNLNNIEQNNLINKIYYTYTNSDKFPWIKVRDKFEDEYFKYLKLSKIKEYYKRIIKTEEDFNNSFNVTYKCEIIQDQGKLVTINKVEGEKEDNNLYCYCKEKYKIGELMVACDYKDECKGSIEGWFHKRCIKEFKDMTQQELDKVEHYVCEECKKFYLNGDVRENKVEDIVDNNGDVVKGDEIKIECKCEDKIEENLNQNNEGKKEL